MKDLDILAILVIISCITTLTQAHEGHHDGNVTKAPPKSTKKQCYVCNSVRDPGCGNSTLLKTKDEWKKDCESLEDYRAILGVEREKYNLPQLNQNNGSVAVPLQFRPAWADPNSTTTENLTFFFVCKKITYKVDRNQPEIKRSDRDNVTGDAKVKRYQRYCGIQIVKTEAESRDAGHSHDEKSKEVDMSKDTCEFGVTETGSKLEITTCICHQNLCNRGGRTIFNSVLWLTLHLMTIVLLNS